MNKIITPSNRTDEVFEVLFNNTPTLDKISVDRTLFDNHPWRLWFHFGVTNTPFNGYTYSYLIESHYKAWLDGAREHNPVSPERVIANSRGVVRCLYGRYFDQPKIHTIALPASVHAAYLDCKEQAFEECTGAAQVIRRLSKFAQDACPERYVPSIADLFRARYTAFTATDLAVDRFLVDQLRQSIDLTNAVAEACS